MRHSSLLKTIGKLAPRIIAVLSFLSVLFGFVVPLRENFELAIIVTILAGSVAALIALVNIATRKDSGKRRARKIHESGRLRPLVVVGIALVVIANGVFFYSPSGNKLVRVALYGTPAPTAVPTFPPATTTPIPFPNNLVSTSFGYETCGSGLSDDFLIPDTIDLGQPAMVLSEQFYSAQVWDTWEHFPITASITFSIKHARPEAGIINIDKTAYVVVDSYEALDHMAIANFSNGTHWLIGADNCGGGGFASAFDVALLRDTGLIAVNTKEFDYYTLQPGEAEYFTMKIMCEEPGLYRYHVEMEMSYFANEGRVVVGPELTTYCPEAIDRWIFADVIKGDPGGSAHAVLVPGEYRFRKMDLSAALEDPNFLPYGRLGLLYEPSDQGTSWLETRPWRPCSDAPPSYIFGGQWGNKYAIVNPNVGAGTIVRREPDPNGEVVAQALPGDEFRLGDSYVCSGGYVWWYVETCCTADRPYLQGWIAERSVEERFLLSCLGNRDCTYGWDDNLASPYLPK